MLKMPRWTGWPLLLAWAPVGLLFGLLMAQVHGAAPWPATQVALRLVGCAALLGLLVWRLTRRLPWPHPFRIGFLGWHLLAAALYSVAWWGLNSLVLSLQLGRPTLQFGPGVMAYLTTGVWLYVMVAGVCYAQGAAERASQLQALAARAQLDALRAQLQPHFFFNALHTVVQLIPLDPDRAVQAAERLAGLLRRSLDEQRERLPLAEEWALVQGYLELEALRFGPRLQLQVDLPPDTLGALLPPFALQTLVENAVRHGAAPQVQPTRIEIQARREGRQLRLRVSDDGAGASAATLAAGRGLVRLREHLARLYGGAARLSVQPQARGVSAELLLPQDD